MESFILAFLDQKWYNACFYLTPLSYAYEAMMVLVLDGSTIDFNPKGFNTDVKTTGSIWLANFGMSAKHYNSDIKHLIYFTIGFFILSGITLQLSYWLSTCNCCSRCSRRSRCGRYSISSICISSSSSSSSSSRRRRSDSSDSADSGNGGYHHPYTNEEYNHDNKRNTTTTTFITQQPHDTTTTTSNQSHHSLVFQNVSCTINHKKILHGISGHVNTKSNGVFGILGPSGAGKTTLLDIIAGRKNTGTYQGNVYVDSIEFTTKLSRTSIFGYVMQDETLIDVLTVKECLLFAASLRFKNGHATKSEIQSIVSEIINDLNLNKCTNNYIGSIQSFRGISGGERKRVSIGMELCSQPPVLLLDEPTTGLDSSSAYKVMSLLKKLVITKKMIIICTIHTPRSDIFHSLGHAFILNQYKNTSKSNIVYSGSPLNIASFFNAIGYTCPLGMNIADYVLDTITTNDYNHDQYNLEIVSYDDIIHSTSNQFQVPTRKSSFELMNHDVDEDSSSPPNRSLESFTTKTPNRYYKKNYTQWDLKYSNNESCYFNTKKFFYSFYILLSSECTQFRRKPQLFIMHIIIAIMTGILFGNIYYSLQPNTDGVWDRLMGLFAQVCLFALLGLSAGGTWNNDRLRFIRERSSGYYTTFPFFCTKYICDIILLRIIPVIVFVLCSYNLIGYAIQYNSTYIQSNSFFNSSGCQGEILHPNTCSTDPLAHPVINKDNGTFGRSKLMLIIVLSIVSISSASIATSISACTGSHMVTNFVSVLIILLMLMFSGALVSHVNMPLFVSWITALSPFSFAFEALSIGHFQEQCFLFNPTTASSLFDPNGRKAKACVETNGYVWLLNFGCTIVANYTGNGDGSTNNENHTSHCQYTNETIDKDIFTSVCLLIMYSVIGLLAFCCIQERR